MKRQIAASALALGILAGCSTAGSQVSRHNATLYVAGVLEETYAGKAGQSYYTLVDHTDEDAQKAFAKNLEAEYAQRLCVRFHLEDQFISRELKEDYLALLDTVYRRAGFQVKTATPLEGDRYCVELSVTPVTFFAAAYADGFEDLRKTFEKEHGQAEEADGAQEPDDAGEGRTTPAPEGDDPRSETKAQRRKAEEALASAWAQEVYDYLYARLDAVTTGAPVTKLVLVSADKDGFYSLSETDLQEIDNLVLQY